MFIQTKDFPSAEIWAAILKKNIESKKRKERHNSERLCLESTEKPF